MTLVNGDDFFTESLRNVKLFIFLLAFVYKVCWRFLTCDCWKMSRVIIFFFKNLYGPRFFSKLELLNSQNSDEISIFDNFHRVFKLSIYFQMPNFLKNIDVCPKNLASFMSTLSWITKQKQTQFYPKSNLSNFLKTKMSKKYCLVIFMVFAIANHTKSAFFGFPLCPVNQDKLQCVLKGPRIIKFR